MDLRDFFLTAHAMSHGRGVAVSEGWNVEDFIFREPADEAELRRRAPGHTSIAWLLWHMARSEDVAVNVAVRGEAGVLERDGWAERLRVERRDIGTGMTDAEVDEFDAQVDVLLLRDYRAAVGQTTRAWVAETDLAGLNQPIPDAGRRAQEAGAFAPAAARLASIWDGRTGAWFLHWLAVGHNQGHLDSIAHLRSLHRQPAG